MEEGAEEELKIELDTEEMLLAEEKMELLMPLLACNEIAEEE